MEGCLVISLDFELMWGNIERWDTEGYGKTNVSHVPEVVKRLLALFRDYEIHATFATVGLIMHRNKIEAVNNKPNVQPSYYRKECSPYYKDYIDSIEEKHESLYFAPDLVSEIKDTTGMEIGTHTYCHYYCWEEGQTAEEFEADIKKAVVLANQNGVEIKSIVFPRNNVTKDYLDICAKYKIESYRGNAIRFFERKHTFVGNLIQKICRFVDAYFNIGGYTSIPYDSLKIDASPINIPASRLLRPYSRTFSFLEPCRLRRIKNEIIHAARNGELYHIWWHPHNFGDNIEENLKFLEEILICFKQCHNKYGMKSFTMDEMKYFLLDK